MKIRTTAIAILCASVLAGCTKVQTKTKAETKTKEETVVTKADFQLDAIRPDHYPGEPGNYYNPDAKNPPRPVNWKTILHLEVVAVPQPDDPTYATRPYDLHGSIDSIVDGKRTHVPIATGMVSDNAVPEFIVFQSSTMGKPNFQWDFTFTKDGRLTIHNTGAEETYYYHRL